MILFYFFYFFIIGMSGRDNNIFYGNTVRASRKLVTNCIEALNLAEDIVVKGNLDVQGDNVASALATTGAPVTISSSAPPTVGQMLVATSATVASWATVGSGDVVGPGSSTDNATRALRQYNW